MSAIVSNNAAFEPRSASATEGSSAHVQNAALLAIAYFAIASTGHSLSPGDDVYGFFWLPAGLLLAALLLTPRVQWLALLAGALVGDAAFGLARDLAPAAIATRFGTTAFQAVLGAVLVERFIGRPLRLATAREFLLFLFMTAMMTTLASALIAVTVLDGFHSADELARALWPRWGSNAMGVLVLAPQVLAWSEPVGPRMDLRRGARRIEAALLILATAACIAFVFVFAEGISSPLRILLAAPAVWAGLRFGLPGATAINLAIALPVAFFTGAALPGLPVGELLATATGPAQTLVALLAVIGPALALVIQESGEQVEALRCSEHEVRRLNRLYASLSAVNHAVLTEATTKSFLEVTCRIIAGEGGLLLAAVGRTNLETGEVEPVAGAGAAIGYLDAIDIRIGDGRQGSGPSTLPLRDGRPYVCDDFQHDPATVPWRERASRFGIRSAAVFPVRRSQGPWGVLAVHAAEIGYFGDKEVRLLVETANNIGFALDNFEREEALRESEQRFRLAMEHSPIGMAIVATDGRWLEANPSLCRIVGYSREELLRIKFQTITHPDDLVADLHQMAELLAGRRDTYRMEKRYIRKDGTTVWIQLDVALVRTPEGSPRYFLSKIQDITARRDAQRRILELNATLERRVAERTRDLEEANHELALANRELEAFSASVSHDLRSPLRLIDGFTQLLARDHVDPLDSKGQADLARIQAAARRMGELIEGLLTLARMARGPLKLEPVDLSAIAGEIVDTLRSQDPARVVRVTIAPGLTATGSATLLRAVMENLLGNAWKFTSNTAGAAIEFGRVDRDGEAMFFVRDNGAGFNMAFADRLFRAFHRLHDEDEYPGSGIGLATVQRILRRHGGRIEAQSEEGEGACFYFSTGESRPVERREMRARDDMTH